MNSASVYNTAFNAAANYPSATTEFTINVSFGSDPIPLTPLDGEDTISLRPTFRWSGIAGADSYIIEWATDNSFTNVVAMDTYNTGGAGTHEYDPAFSLPYGTLYWRVRAAVAGGMISATTEYRRVVIALSGVYASAVTFSDTLSPYLITNDSGPVTVNGASDGLQQSFYGAVFMGANLIINDSVVVLFDADTGGGFSGENKACNLVMADNAGMAVLGTAPKGVLFTSNRDAAHGMDTSAPAYRGDWGSIFIGADSMAVNQMSYATLRYGGGAGFDDDGDSEILPVLWVGDSTVFTNLTIENSYGDLTAMMGANAISVGDSLSFIGAPATSTYSWNAVPIFHNLTAASAGTEVVIVGPNCFPQFTGATSLTADIIGNPVVELAGGPWGALSGTFTNPGVPYYVNAYSEFGPANNYKGLLFDGNNSATGGATIGFGPGVKVALEPAVSLAFVNNAIPIINGSAADSVVIGSVAAVMYNRNDMSQNAGGIAVDTWALPAPAAQIAYAQLKGLGSSSASSVIPNLGIKTAANTLINGVEMVGSRGINACSVVTVQITASSFSADTAQGGIINNSDNHSRASDAVTLTLMNNNFSSVAGYYGIIVGAGDTLNATGNTFSGPGTALLIQDDLTVLSLGDVHGAGAGGNTFTGFTGDSMSYAVEVAANSSASWPYLYKFEGNAWPNYLYGNGGALNEPILYHHPDNMSGIAVMVDYADSHRVGVSKTGVAPAGGVTPGDTAVAMAFAVQTIGPDTLTHMALRSVNAANPMTDTQIAQMSLVKDVNNDSQYTAGVDEVVGVFAGAYADSTLFTLSSAGVPIAQGVGSETGLQRFLVTVNVNPSAYNGVLKLSVDSSTLVVGDQIIPVSTADTAMGETVYLTAGVPRVASTLSRSPLIAKNTVVQGGVDTFVVMVQIQNTGGAPVGVDTITIRFYDGATDSTAGFTRVGSDPSDSGYVTGDTLQGGASDTYWFVYSAPTAGTVTYSITADFSGTDLVGGGALSNTGPNDDTGQITVDIERPLTVNDIVVSAATAVQGQQSSFLIAVRLTNPSVTGQTGILVDSGVANLIFTNVNSGDTRNFTITGGETLTSGGTQVAPGGSDTILFTVAGVDSTAPLGAYRIDYTVGGVNQLGAPLPASSSIGQAAVEDTFTVVAPGVATLLSVVMDSATMNRGQAGINVILSVENTGGNAIVVGDARDVVGDLIFTGGGAINSDSFSWSFADTYLPAYDTALAVGETTILRFHVSADNFFPDTNTTVTVDGAVKYRDSIDTMTVRFDTGSASTDQFQVNDTAAVNLVSLTLDTPTFFAGIPNGITLNLRNNAVADTAIIEQVYFRFVDITNGSDSTANFAVVQNSGNTTVLGGATNSLHYEVTPSATVVAGVTVQVGCTVVYRDVNSQAAFSDSSSVAEPEQDSAVVAVAGFLQLHSVACETAIASQGQNGLVMVLRVANPGGGTVTQVVEPTLRFDTGATGLSATLSSSIDTSTGSAVSFPTSMAPGANIYCTYTVNVASNASTGVIYLQGNVSGFSVDAGVAVADSAVDPSADILVVNAIGQLKVNSIDFFPLSDSATAASSDTIIVWVEVQNVAAPPANAVVVAAESTNLVVFNGLLTNVTNLLTIADTHRIRTIATPYLGVAASSIILAPGETAAIAYFVDTPAASDTPLMGDWEVYVESGTPRASDTLSAQNVSDPDGVDTPGYFHINSAWVDISAGPWPKYIFGADNLTGIIIGAGAWAFPPNNINVQVNLRNFIGSYDTAIAQANTLTPYDTSLAETSIIQIVANRQPNGGVGNELFLQLSYSDSGMSSSRERGLRVFKLVFDTPTATWNWQMLPGQTAGTGVFTETDIVRALVVLDNTDSMYGFSVFRILPAVSGAADNLDNVIVFPNPWKPWDGRPETGNINDGIFFTNLTVGSQLRIFNILGELVFTGNSPTGDAISWSGRNNAGRAVASGVYIWVVTDSAGRRATGKVAIIR